MSEASGTTARTDAHGAAAPPEKIELGVSQYDRVAGLLVALLLLIGFLVLILLLLWFTSRVFAPQEAVQVELLEDFATTDNAFGSGTELTEPGLEELEDQMEPQLENTLKAITDAISTEAGALEAIFGDAKTNKKGKPDSRPGRAGPQWEIRYDSSSLTKYARLLDSLGIELAALGGGEPMVDYARKLSGSNPTRRQGKPADEKRRYLTWQRGKLQDADRELLARAGIETSGRLIVQFLPPALAEKLAGLEENYAGNRETHEIRKTVFGVVSQGGRPSFYVKQQTYRK